MTIQLVHRRKIGLDAFNRMVYGEEITEDIENVLIGQPSDADLATAQNLTGRRVSYVLGIPKGDKHDWENRKVILPAPFSGIFRTIGFSVAGIDENMPLSWNRKVMVERFE